MSGDRQRWQSLDRGLIAILRGIRPEETEAVVTRLADCGFGAIEIPLNSADPFASIEIAVKTVGDRCLVGAGTVLTTDEVGRLRSIGATLSVSPNTDEDVIRDAVGLRMAALPGVFTATEALAACRAGASALKFFPAFRLGPDGIAAIRAVLPEETLLVAVGGISEADFKDYAAHGLSHFGLGSSLYKPGMNAETVAERGAAAVAAWDAVFRD